MDYRNDLEATRLRITTLEAKLEESKAALEARDAELAEFRAERDRRQPNARNGPSLKTWGIPFSVGAGFGCALGLITMMVFVVGGKSAEQPAATTPPSVTAVVEEGKGIKGRLNNVPEQDPGPSQRSRAIGFIESPPTTPPTPPATVLGQTNAATDGKTVASVIESARTKIHDCHHEETKAHPEAKGRVNVKFEIEPSGKVSQVKLEPPPNKEPWWSKTFETCVAGVYRTLEFPNDTGTKVTANNNYSLNKTDLGF